MLLVINSLYFLFSWYTDVWGSSKVPNCFGVKWFVSFVDDCTQMTWVYLVKDKAAIGDIMSLFHRMILTQFGFLLKGSELIMQKITLIIT